MQAANFAYASTLKTEAISSSEMLVDFQQAMRSYIPLDRTLHERKCFEKYIGDSREDKNELEDNVHLSTLSTRDNRSSCSKKSQV
jgi:hypothetical protein